MIPLRIFRALLLLFTVSGVLALADYALAVNNVHEQYVKVLTGFLAGVVVFFLAYEGGRVLRFCGKGLVSDATREGHINRALGEIGRNDAGVQVSLVETDSFLASTVREGRGHRMFISTCIVDSLSPVALRGVLAHELGHVESAHPIKLAVLLGLLAAVKLSVGVPLGAVLAILVAFLFMLREWECVADSHAVDSAGQGAVLSAFEEYRVIAGDREIGRIEEWFSGHPSTQRRIAAVNRK